MTGASEEHVLHVVMNGRVIGDVQRTGKRRMRLRYEDVGGAGTFTPLSVTMPGPTGRYREGVLAPWLEGLLPDRPETLRQWRRRFGVIDTGPLALLTHVGEDVAGAAQFVRPSRLEHVLTGKGDMRALTGADVAQMLRRAKADLPVSLDDSHTGKFSLAGAQAKIALHRTSTGWSDPSGSIPSTHIVKPAIPAKEDQDLVEHVTMQTAAALGLRVARSTVEEFDDERAVVVERYDRLQARGSGKWMRIHQEDMCQALGVWTGLKYENQGGPSAGAVADLLNQLSTAPDGGDNRRFAQALIFNWLTCGTDAHARNYSILLSGSDVRLAPLYDLNTHLAYSDGSGNDLSMSVGGEFRAASITRSDWVAAARTLHVEPDWIHNEVDRQTSGVMDALSQATAAEDVASFKSPVMTRLRNDASRWVKARPARAKSSRSQRPSRGKTSAVSNSTSFKARERAETDVRLDEPLGP